MANKSNKNSSDNIGSKYPVIANFAIIVLIAVLGLWIVYLSLGLFTKHGQKETVPNIENMTYTKAIQLLHDHGFRVDIRDSVYRDDVRPGLVVEQFPEAGAMVKPGRKIFLYINAVNPKEVVIDDDNSPLGDALKGMSSRQALAHLEELGFSNIAVVSVLGDNDLVVKVLADGKTVKKMQKVSIKSRIILEVSDGRLSILRDSLHNQELGNSAAYDYNSQYSDGSEYDDYDYSDRTEQTSNPEPVRNHNESESESLEGVF